MNSTYYPDFESSQSERAQSTIHLCGINCTVYYFVCACYFFVQTFQKDEKLREFFQIVSTNKDKKGKVFISTMEGMPLLNV